MLSQLRGAVFFSMFVCPLGMLCQNARLSPRDLFLEAEHRTGMPLSVRYTVLRQNDEGRFTGVNPATAVFYNGDRVRLRVQANQKAFVTVLQRGSSGAWGVLYPREGAPADPLESFETFDIPAMPGTFAFDDRPGEERIILLVSREPVSANHIAQRLNRESQQAGPLPSRDLDYQTVDQDARSGYEGTAVYVSNTKAADDPPLLVHLKLQHHSRISAKP